MKGINKLRKVKERKLYKLDSISELNNFDFDEAIPINARKVEITSRENKLGIRTLEIDYILDLKIENLELVKHE